MALRIIRGTDPITVNTTVTTIYGPPGSLKTSLAQTCALPYVLDFDDTIHRAAFRNAEGMVVTPEAWADMREVNAAAVADYQTVVVDTAGRALDMITRHIIEKDPKMGFQGALSLQGYGRLKSTFAPWISQLRSFGKDVVLVAHMTEKDKGDETAERLDIQGGSKDEIYKVSDQMGRLKMINGQLHLLFSPSDTAFGKNPAQHPALVVPAITSPAWPTFLADLIAKTKAHLNRQSEESRELTALLAEWQKDIARAKTAATCTSLIVVAESLDERVRPLAKKALNSHAKDIGLTYNTTKKCFTEVEEKVGAQA